MRPTTRRGEGAAASARRELIQRYGGAAYRYLLGALKSPEAAEELLQDFSLRFIRGDFRRADPCGAGSATSSRPRSPT